jgi:hypothetical protein
MTLLIVRATCRRFLEYPAASLLEKWVPRANPRDNEASDHRDLGDVLGIA